MMKIEMRAPCKHCGGKTGGVAMSNGQAVVRCQSCNKWCYNAPKSELGVNARELQCRSNVSPTTWARIIERDGARCVCCGADSTNTILHVSHIISHHEAKLISEKYGIDGRFVNTDENLVVCCEVCNLGQAHRSMIPKLAVFCACHIDRTKKQEEK
jgi:hypothetical protein